MKRPRLIVAAGEDGQSMVEFALVLPVLVALLIAVVEFGVVFKDWINVTDAARIAARAAAVARFDSGSPDPCTAAQEALTAQGDGGLTLASCSQSSGQVTVKVTHPWSVGVPFLPFSDGGDLKSVVTERLE